MKVQVMFPLLQFTLVFSFSLCVLGYGYAFSDADDVSMVSEPVRGSRHSLNFSPSATPTVFLFAKLLNITPRDSLSYPSSSGHFHAALFSRSMLPVPTPSQDPPASPSPHRKHHHRVHHRTPPPPPGKYRTQPQLPSRVTPPMLPRRPALHLPPSPPFPRKPRGPHLLPAPPHKHFNSSISPPSRQELPPPGPARFPPPVDHAPPVAFRPLPSPSRSPERPVAPRLLAPPPAVVPRPSSPPLVPMPVSPPLVVITPSSPPPPSEDCGAIVCLPPLTKTPFMSPCGCVRPIQVRIELTVPLYSLFPLISVLAANLAESTVLSPNQVEIIGANADSQNPDNSVVDANLVPLDQGFDNLTALIIFEKFWKHEVILNSTLFGNYSVVYVEYPGLPPSPPSETDPGERPGAPPRLNPVGVVVKAKHHKLGIGTIAVVALSSAIVLVVCLAALWFVLSKASCFKGIAPPAEGGTVVSARTKRSEQEKIVRALEASHARQSFTWRVIFATLTSAFGAFFLISAYWQLLSPWDLKYHAYFMEEMSTFSVVIADVAEAFVYASLAWGLLSSNLSHHFPLRVSFGAGLGLAVFWLYYMQRLSRMHWDLLWLPLGPCSCAALCMYVDHLIVETGKDVDKLRTAMYHFKRT